MVIGKTDKIYKFGPFDEIIILGGGHLAKELCKWAIYNSQYKIKFITSPRHLEEIIEGKKLIDYLKQENIKFLSMEKFQSEKVIKFSGKRKSTFYLSLGASWIFSKENIKKCFDNQLFNLHGTRLPQNRGGGGFSWQILMGNRFGFCVLHLVDGGIDTGEIVFLEEFLYSSKLRTPKDYNDIYIKNNLKFLKNILIKFFVKPIYPQIIKQSEYFSTYWPRLNTFINGWIDWSLNVSEIERFICAFDDPYEGSKTMLNDEKVVIKKISVNYQDGKFHSFQRGIIYRKSKNWICVAAIGGAIIIEKLLNEKNHNLIDSVNVGDRFYTPIELLEKSIKRVGYDSKGLIKNTKK